MPRRTLLQNYDVICRPIIWALRLPTRRTVKAKLISTLAHIVDNLPDDFLAQLKNGCADLTTYSGGLECGDHPPELKQVLGPTRVDGVTNTDGTDTGADHLSGNVFGLHVRGSNITGSILPHGAATQVFFSVCTFAILSAAMESL